MQGYFAGLLAINCSWKEEAASFQIEAGGTIWAADGELVQHLVQGAENGMAYREGIGKRAMPAGGPSFFGGRTKFLKFFCEDAQRSYCYILL